MSTQNLSEEQKEEISNSFLNYVKFIKEQSEGYTQKTTKFQEDCLDDNIDALAEFEIIRLENTLDDFEKSDAFDLLVNVLEEIRLSDPNKGGNLWVFEYGVKNYFRSSQIYDSILNDKPFEPNPDEFIESIFAVADCQEKYTSCLIVRTPLRLVNDIDHFPLYKKPAEWWAEVILEFPRRNYPRYYESMANAPLINMPSAKKMSNLYVLVKEHQACGEDCVDAYNFSKEKLVLQLASPCDIEFSNPMLFNRNPCSTCNTNAYFQMPHERIEMFTRAYHDIDEGIKQYYDKMALQIEAKLLDLISKIFQMDEDQKRLRFVGKIFNKSCETPDNDIKFMFLWGIIEALTKKDPDPSEKWFDHTPRNLDTLLKTTGLKFAAFVDLIRDVSKAKSALAHGDFRYDFGNFELAMQRYMPKFDIHYLRSFARFLILYFCSALHFLGLAEPHLQSESVVNKFFESLKAESKLKELNAKIVEYWGEYQSLIFPT